MNKTHTLTRRFTSWVGAMVTTAVVVAQSPNANVLDPLSIEGEQSSFKVLPNFEISLYASERDGVVKPIQIRFDGDGRLWIAGSVAYPQLAPGQKPDDKIVVVEDRDRDGRVDRTTVFADGLLMPTGLELGDGGVYVGVGSELLHLRDTDGDGKADQRRVIFSGFGTGDTHQTINSFTWGPSGELMLSQGLHALSRIETPWGTEQLRQSGVWRFWPKRLRMDAFWDGAMGAHNPFGTTFDRWGQPLVLAGNGHGIYHLTPAMIRTEHFLLQSSIWNQGRKFGGADIVENAHWPSEYQGQLVAGGYLQNTVERFTISDHGSTFKAERLPPLIESTNTAFRIVDARFGPDGALYLCDWCNPVIGHYQTSFRHPDRDRTRGRIWRLAAKNRPLASWKPLEKSSVSELLKALLSPERWNRQMAKRILQDRPESEVGNALKVWSDSLVPGTTGAEQELYEALGIYAARETVQRDLLVRAAAASAPWLRAYAARVTGHWANRVEKPLDILTPLATDLDARVRLEAVVACSYVSDPSAIEVAVRAMDRQPDAATQYAFTQCVQALKPVWQQAYSRGELKFGGNARQLAAFTRADRSTDTVALAVNRLRRIGEVALDVETLTGLLQLVADAGGPADLAALFPANTYKVGTNYYPSLHARFLDHLAEAKQLRGVTPEGDLATRLRPLLDSSESQVKHAALRLAGSLGVEPLRSQVMSLVRNASASPIDRAAAVSAMGRFGGSEGRQLIQTLANDAQLQGLVRGHAVAEWIRTEPRNSGAAAVSFLSTPQPEAAVGEVITALLSRKEAFTGLSQAVGARSIDSTAARYALRQMAAVGRRDEALATILERAAGWPSEKRRWSPQDLTDFLLETRRDGNIQRGEAIFRRDELGCVQCHGINATQMRIGPDLGALGTAQTAEFIVGAILEPQREIKEGFFSVELTLKDGEELTGRLVVEDAREIVLHDNLTRRDVRISRDQIRQRTDIGSAMPVGLADTLTRAEFRDLIRYLISLGRRDL